MNVRVQEDDDCYDADNLRPELKAGNSDEAVGDDGAAGAEPAPSPKLPGYSVRVRVRESPAGAGLLARMGLAAHTSLATRLFGRDGWFGPRLALPSTAVLASAAVLGGVALARRVRLGSRPV